MSDRKNQKALKVWLGIIAVVLIILLFVWLTIADLWGDTDVAAFMAPSALFPL